MNDDDGVTGQRQSKAFELEAKHIALLSPSMGGPRRKSPQKPRKPPPPKVDPPELLIPVSEMTAERWAAWDWPADHLMLPWDKRKVALILWRRDGNICQVCGLKVDISLRKSHPGMASCDHIIPLRRYEAKYDTQHLNVWGNVKLAHLYCNTAHADFDARFIAVEDYRTMLRAATARFESTGSCPPPRTAMLGIDAPLLTPAWEAELLHGRPTGTFGEEWSDTRTEA
ncbi:HNH endonuclease [Arthrobacter sp. FW306-2-2C-D06B]|uniref:HNH endonuclease n=1 Tax=Arthrobacter sp. FW306-2-2C-D06B TaxID=2879618 RepID=UPI001F201EFA|nr:HNH endonuclease [Arthrobacter sp. FW306-2-2C-D06B]UKA59139.1 HNH endonuclease [Arthrobacter sp. FW306-2-2C-D06B]